MPIFPVRAAAYPLRPSGAHRRIHAHALRVVPSAVTVTGSSISERRVVMKNILIIGAGKIGRMAAHFLAHTGDYKVHVIDSHEPSWKGAIAGLPNASGATADFVNQVDLDAALKGQWGLISCAPFFCNPLIAERAKSHGVHYLDLTEDVAVTKKVMALAQGASTAFIPQCGLAPGYITIAANHLAKPMSEIHELRCRVGALPRNPTNQLKYNMTWSTNQRVLQSVRGIGRWQDDAACAA